MSHSYRPGQTLRLTEDGRLVTIWSAAPGPGCYWAHIGEATEGEPRPVRLVRVTDKQSAPKPVVTIVEDQ